MPFLKCKEHIKARNIYRCIGLLGLFFADASGEWQDDKARNICKNSFHKIKGMVSDFLGQIKFIIIALFFFEIFVGILIMGIDFIFLYAEIIG